MKKKTTPQTKPTIDRESVRVLAIELGAREAARRVGVNESTVLSWARRDKWKLPKRTGGATLKNAAAITLRSKPGDVLIATHEELGERSRTAVLQAATAAAEQVRDRKRPLPVNDVQQLQQLTSALARVLGWGADSRPSVNYYGDVNTVVVCDPKRRQELIEQRQRLLEQEATQASGRKVAAAVPVALPARETQSNASVGAVDGTATDDHPPVVQKDSLSQWRDSVGRADTWKTNEPENNAGSFGPHPEEIY